MADDTKLIAGLQAAWTREIAGAKTYRALAQRASSPEQRDILNRLADAEERHAQTWGARLKELGSAPPKLRESFFERARRWVLVQSGTQNALRNIEATEDSDQDAYAQLLTSATEEKDRVAVRATEVEEKTHAKLLGDMTTPPSLQSRLDSMMQTEKWHVRGGGWIGQAIYGMNDGLGAAFGVVCTALGAFIPVLPFFFLTGSPRARHVVRHQHGGAFRRRRVQGDCDGAQLVEERAGDDGGRLGRSDDYVHHRVVDCTNGRAVKDEGGRASPERSRRNEG